MNLLQNELSNLRFQWILAEIVFVMKNSFKTNNQP